MIRRYNFRLIGLLLLTFNVQGHAQTGNNPDWSVVSERVILQTDRDIYIAGEELFFSADCFTGAGRSLPQLSNILYVELIDCSTRTPALRKKYKIRDFRVSNTLVIPPEINTGVYLLRAYTLYMQNFPPGSFANHYISILNPVNPAPQGVVFRSAGETGSAGTVEHADRAYADNSMISSESPAHEMEIETNKSVVHPGEQVQVRYGANGESLCGVATVRVVLKGTTLADPPGVPMHFSENNRPPVPPTPDYIPEIRDLSLRGILRDKTSLEPLAGQDVYASVLFNNPQLHISRTNEKGEFIVTLNNLTGVNDIFITPETGDPNSKEKEILIRMPFSAEVPFTGSIPLVLTSGQREVLEIMYANFQIQEKFGSKKEDQAPTRNRVHTFNIDGPKTTVKSEDYVRMENLREMFSEIVPNVSIRKNGHRFAFTVSDQNGNALPGTPLVLLDHVPVFDLNALLEIPVSEIEKVDVINTTYLLGINSINGIVMITTKNSNFGGMTFSGPATFLEFQALEKSADPAPPAQDVTEDTPDFRTTLYWNPEAPLSGNRGSVEFTASDRKAEYLICIMGYAADGTCYYGSKTILIE